MSSWFHRIKTPRISQISKTFKIRVIRGVFAFFLAAGPAYAEREYIIGTSVDFMGGVSNQVGQSSFNLSRLEEGVVPFYGVYPSISLNSVGQRSEIDLNYTFVAERFQMSPHLTTTSHAVTGNFTAQLGRTVRLRISDTFNTVPDYSTINVLQGFTYTPEGFQYVFEPQLYKRSSISNNGNIGLDVDLGPKSYLTFAASGSYRHYDKGFSPTYFTDQTRLEGSLAFSRKQAKRLTWSVKYAIRQNDYENYAPSRTHSGTFGLSAEVSPTLNLTLEAGPAFVDIEDSYIGYYVNASIAKQIQANRFTAGYSHHAGDSTGLGSGSESHNGALGFSRTIGRKGSISFDASAFRQSQRGIDVYDYWGARGSLALSRQLGEHWVVSVGGSYMTYIGQSGNYDSYAYERVYVSFGFRFPELFRTKT